MGAGRDERDPHSTSCASNVGFVEVIAPKQQCRAMIFGARIGKTITHIQFGGVLALTGLGIGLQGYLIIMHADLHNPQIQSVAYRPYSFAHGFA